MVLFRLSRYMPVVLHLSYVTTKPGYPHDMVDIFFAYLCMLYALLVLFLPILLSLFFMFIKQALKEWHMHACMLIIDLIIANEY